MSVVPETPEVARAVFADALPAAERYVVGGTPTNCRNRREKCIGSSKPTMPAIAVTLRRLSRSSRWACRIRSRVAYCIGDISRSRRVSRLSWAADQPDVRTRSGRPNG